eukprot:CAMPEP_0178426270 /NCGR_PEP_ID=MMETSP0689_2-20121128/29150_1 /TAXON_ID=160604 /ORGANISM="Amphidinium massartii, Strain CS-259" /LENGTH=99 /DNA_ID=CAMNT_0020047955 /DNA_START=366 /DNA_END=665 /DNA_ORIENTATION=-
MMAHTAATRKKREAASTCTAQVISPEPPVGMVSQYGTSTFSAATAADSPSKSNMKEHNSSKEGHPKPWNRRRKRSAATVKAGARALMQRMHSVHAMLTP